MWPNSEEIIYCTTGHMSYEYPPNKGSKLRSYAKSHHFVSQPGYYITNQNYADTNYSNFQLKYPGNLNH